MGQQTAANGTGRKEQIRHLADEGLSVREISEQTGHPKSTVHRDLQGYEPDTRSQELRLAREIEAEVRELQELQVAARGTRPGPVLDGKPTTVPGPYVPSPENEERASQIIQLRKQAARIRYPLAA